jgi:uncharacterized protein (DUF3084 family)
MFWTVLALIALVALGGFISYYGDLQGRRWGKKRVTWFGLRPKHTAILITCLTGAFIAMLSIATLFIAAPTVREVVLSGEKAISENKELLADQARQKREFTAQLTDKSNRLNITTAKLNDYSARYASTLKDYEAIQQKNRIIERDNGTLITQNVDLQKQRFKLEGLMKQERATVYALRGERKQLTQQNERAGQMNKDLGSQNIRLTRDNVDLSRQNEQFQAVNAELRDAKAKLQQEYDEIDKAKEAAMRANETQIAANRVQVQEAQRLESRIQELTQKQNDLYLQMAGAGRTFNEAYNALRQGRLILRVGAELARDTLDSHLRPEAVRRELSALLDDASAQALRRGAARGENGRAVQIVSKRVVTLAGEQDANEEASLGALVENLTGSDTPVVVLVNAVNNTVEGETVMVELTPRPVKRVFPKGAVVASRRIDARQPVDRLVDTILDFLQNDVRNAAMQAGTIPQVDPETGQPQVGIVGPKDLIVLTDRLRRMGGQVLLTAVAAAPLTSADPLRLDFKLSRPSAKTQP